jgi:hypothetical protein
MEREACIEYTMNEKVRYWTSHARLIGGGGVCIEYSCLNLNSEPGTLDTKHSVCGGGVCIEYTMISIVCPNPQTLNPKP